MTDVQQANFVNHVANTSRRLKLVSLLVVIGFVPVFVFPRKRTSTMTSSIAKPNSVPCKMLANESVAGWVRPPVTYAHIHMAKTGGTTINGYLAAHFERVCGNKGYSYDANQFNKRASQSNRHGLYSAGSDLVSKKYKGSNRGKVPDNVVKTIGLENCDYISMEMNWRWWHKNLPHTNLEMHLPCRDPVDHILSQCNYLHRKYRCDVPPEEAVENCTMRVLNRFHWNLTLHPKYTVKCFDYDDLSDYLEFMGTKLQRQRVESSYRYRFTNRPRNKTEECLLNSSSLMAQVREILIEEHDYYDYCDECLESENDLLWTA